MSEKPVTGAAAAPDDLAALAAAGAELDAKAAPSGAPPPGAAPGAKEIEMSSADVILMVGGPWFDILAPNWKVSQDEKKQLSVVYGALIDKYFPDWATRFGPEIACCVVTGAVFAPRIVGKVPRVLEAPKKPEDKADAAAPGA